MRFLALALALALATPAWAAVEREVDRPVDGSALYLTVAGTPGNGGFEALRFAFEMRPDLKQIKSSCHFRVLSTRDPDYAERYSDQFTTLPTVRLQSADGLVVYEVSGEGIPTLDRLAVELASHVTGMECHRRRHGDDRYEKDGGDRYDVAPPHVVTPPAATPTDPPVRRVPLWRVLLYGCVSSLGGWVVGAGYAVAKEWVVR